MTNLEGAQISATKITAHPEQQSYLSQFVQTEAEKEAATAAPARAAQRLIGVTKEGIARIPEGFMRTLDLHSVLPNIGAGFAIGALSKAFLPDSGPVATMANGLMTAYFLGKPLLDCYQEAFNAKTMSEMHHAAAGLGNLIGGMPVHMVESRFGAMLGSHFVENASKSMNGIKPTLTPGRVYPFFHSSLPIVIVPGDYNQDPAA